MLNSFLLQDMFSVLLICWTGYGGYSFLALIVKPSPAVCYCENKTRYVAKNNEYYVCPTPGTAVLAKYV